MTDISVMTLDHYDQVLQLWRSTEGVMLIDADQPDRISQYFSRNPALSHVAIADARIVGAALCGHDGRRGYLHHLAVAESYRGQGIGRGIVSACLTALKRQGITACNLFILDDNQVGKDFWARDDWNQWPNLRVMTKRLDK